MKTHIHLFTFIFALQWFYLVTHTCACIEGSLWFSIFLRDTVIHRLKPFNLYLLKQQKNHKIKFQRKNTGIYRCKVLGHSGVMDTHRETSSSLVLLWAPDAKVGVYHQNKNTLINPKETMWFTVAPRQ